MSGVLQRAMLSAGRFRRLDRPERSVFISAVLSMAVVRVALLFFPIRRILRASHRLGRRWPIRLANAVPLERAARRITQAKRFCPRSTCLSEAIAGHFVMSRLGFDSDVRIGVDKTGNEFKAHAWLECPDDIVVGDPAPEGKHFAPMPSLRRFVA